MELSPVKLRTSGAIYLILPTLDYVLSLFLPELQAFSISISEKILTKPKSDILMESSFNRRFSG